MRVLILSTNDKSGGAAISAYRLHQAQKQMGIDSMMLVREKSGHDPTVYNVREGGNFIERNRYKLSQMLEYRPLAKYPERNREPWHIAHISNGIEKNVNNFNPDIIILDWVWGGFVPVQAIPNFNHPLIWKLSDSAAFTGGCHLSYDCRRFEERCGYCPVLKSKQEQDLSRKTWERKHRHWQNVNLTIVSLSHWMAERARASQLFREYPVHVIPIGLDMDVFRPINRKIARDLLGLPQDKQLILFGAVNALSNHNKGFHLLQAALKILSHQGLSSHTDTVIFGVYPPKTPPDTGFESHFTGILKDPLTLALVYSAADVMVVPSLQETLVQTACEAMACGTPVVLFGATGSLDIVDHQQNGYLATPYEPADLAAGITWVLEDDERREQLAQNARETAVKKFDIQDVAKQYIDLYQTILDKENNT